MVVSSRNKWLEIKMLSKKDKLLTHPWIIQRYENHRKKVNTAGPAIDFNTPTNQPHVTLKLKKIQRERERLDNINKENQRLLQRLGEIMNIGRLENYWRQPPPKFLNREFLFKIRPKTTTIKRTNTQDIHEFSIDERIVKRNLNCGACSGKPYKKNQVIPEERVPWEPPRKSWNKKFFNEIPTIYRSCKLCS